VAFDVVIAGGGFGGLYAARRPERRLQRHSARIRIVSDASLGAYLEEVAQPGEIPGDATGDA
jgi:NADH dehydrogenase